MKRHGLSSRVAVEGEWIGGTLRSLALVVQGFRQCAAHNAPLPPHGAASRACDKTAYPSVAKHEITQVPPQIFHNRAALSSSRGGFVDDIK
jgi:hypothetical protein